jgi:uncharacterized Zn finger protein (UPF0148 family)
VICPACGAGNVPGEAFCDYCGSPLDAPLPDEAEAPAPASAQAAPAEEEAAEAAAPAADQEEGAAAGALACPICGVEVSADEAFCANCGASLAQAPIPPEPVPEAAPEVAPEPETAPAPEAEPPAPEAAVAAPPPEPEPAVEEAAPAPATPAPVAPAPAAEPAALNCPACGAEIEPGDVFCSACGFSLEAPAAPAAAPAAAAPAPTASPAPTAAPAPAAAPAPGAGPRLVIAASGAEIPLPAKEEIIVGREDPVSGIYPDVDLTPHGGESGGVSRRHARILVEGGQYYVEDLDSTNFTFVNKQKLAPKTRQVVRQGDEIRFGRVAAVLHTA